MTDTPLPIATTGIIEDAAAADKIAVYYNSACPVCRRGIEWQQGQMAACEIEWIDVHRSSDAMSQIHADLDITDLESVRERWHVRDAQGRVLVGADAVVFMMGRTRKQRWLWRFAGDTSLGSSVIRPAMRWAYDAFARVLYRWNRGKGRW